MLFSEIV